MICQRSKPLLLSPQPLELELRFSKHVDRELGLIDPKLLDAIHNLACGAGAWPLFIHGQPGTGKTCTGLALCDHVRGSLYETAASITHRHHMEITGRGPIVPWDRIQGGKGAQNYRLVVLDELGVRKVVTDTHYEAVQRVLDLRSGWPLIVISNLDGNDLAKVYDARIADRVMAGSQWEMKGESRRTG